MKPLEHNETGDLTFNTYIDVGMFRELPSFGFRNLRSLKESRFPFV
jgi:hypothetical protein